MSDMSGITDAGNLIAVVAERDDQADQNLLNQDILTDIELLRREGFGRRAQFWNKITVDNSNTPKTIIQLNKYTYVKFNPTSAVLSSLFPASGLDPNDLFLFADDGNLAATWNCTVNSNGWPINGTVQDYVIKANRGWVLFRFVNENIGFSIAAHSIIENSVHTVVSTNFKKIQKIDSISIFVSNGTTPNGNLTGVAGDICYNGPSGQPFYCSSSGTTWVGM